VPEPNCERERYRGEKAAQRDKDQHREGYEFQEGYHRSSSEEALGRRLINLSNSARVIKLRGEVNY
jgi:hypothetical protein